ncbi:MAG: hypothetical protein IT426_19905 [Pirellulales bacterium]|nr:hypothetical protein [Pirellulales bacterium]
MADTLRSINSQTITARENDPGMITQGVTMEEMISVADVAKQLGKIKQSVFKVIKRLEINVMKRRAGGNQLAAYVTQSDFNRIKAEIAAREKRTRSDCVSVEEDDGFISAEQGVFYLVQLESDHDAGRFKVGFAANMPDRLRQLRCSAPFATVLKT